MTNPKTQVESLTITASKGVLWSGMSVLTVSLLQFITTAVLARFLGPADFGTIGMATLVGGIVSLFGNLGLGAALVQKKTSKIFILARFFV
jgi:PST family polysaccharide transporter